MNGVHDLVADDGECTLREAIDVANGTAHVDCTGDATPLVITFDFGAAPVADIQLTSALPTITAGTADVPLTITGSTDITVFIDGQSTYPIMKVASGAHLTLTAVTMFQSSTTTANTAALWNDGHR